MLIGFDFSSKTGILVVKFAFATANLPCACADVLHACYLKGIKESVEFAFIPWSVPAKSLLKDRNC